MDTSTPKQGSNMLQAADMIALGMPEAQAQRTQGVTRARLSAEMKQVIEIMAYEGLPLPQAVERVGMNLKSAKKAMTKPHVKHAFNQLVAEIRSSAGQLAYLRINRMGSEAQSEPVKLEANKWIAGVDNIAPIRRVEGKYQHNHSFGGFEFGDYDTIEHEASDTASVDDDD